MHLRAFLFLWENVFVVFDSCCKSPRVYLSCGNNETDTFMYRLYKIQQMSILLSDKLAFKITSIFWHLREKMLANMPSVVGDITNIWFHFLLYSTNGLDENHVLFIIHILWNIRELDRSLLSIIIYRELKCLSVTCEAKIASGAKFQFGASSTQLSLCDKCHLIEKMQKQK